VAKVLLVDTNFSSAPIYRSLVADGHEVHVVGGNPDDCLAKQAAHYWRLDYSDTEALSALVSAQGFSHLVPGCTDRSYASCVAIGEGRFAGLDSLFSTSSINHKGKFRHVAAQLGLPIPRVFADAATAVGESVIVKPPDAFSGKGISILVDADRARLDDAMACARAASASGQVMIEEFVEGQLYSHSAFLVRHKIVCDFLVREDGTANRFVVDTSRVLDVSEFETFMNPLRNGIEALAAHLGLNDGLLHTQFIACDKRLWLIETTRRCPGDLYSQLIELSTGYAYAHNYTRPFLGDAPIGHRCGALRPIMRHTISVPAAQAFDHVHFLRPLEIERYVPLHLVGAHLSPSPHSRVALMFCRERSQEALDELYATTLRRGLYAVSDGRDTPQVAAARA